jgi:hypothetical protein
MTLPCWSGVPRGVVEASRLSARCLGVRSPESVSRNESGPVGVPFPEGFVGATAPGKSTMGPSRNSIPARGSTRKRVTTPARSQACRTPPSALTRSGAGRRRKRSKPSSHGEGRARELREWIRVAALPVDLPLVEGGRLRAGARRCSGIVPPPPPAGWSNGSVPPSHSRREGGAGD